MQTAHQPLTHPAIHHLEMIEEGGPVFPLNEALLTPDGTLFISLNTHTHTSQQNVRG